MHKVASRDLPLRQREVRGEAASDYYELFPPQPPMSAEEELRLVHSMKEGSRDAEDVLTRQYAGVGISMALRFKQSARYEGSDLDDLVGAALLGVVEGLRHYDETRGARVSTCIWFWVRAQLRRCKHKQRFVTYPQAKEEFLVKLSQEARLFFNATGRRPTQEELAESLETTPEIMTTILSEASSTTTYSVDTSGVPNADSTSSLWTEDFYALDQEDVPESSVTIEEYELLEDSIDGLDEREAAVIRYRFIDELTLKVIAGRLKLSRERIRQIETQALKKLRKALKEKLDL
jgi:RNA polymerase primary sigma factor